MKRTFLAFLCLSMFFAGSAYPAGTLFGLRNPGDGGRQVITVDPVTGAVTPVSASISPPLPSSSGDNAIDVAGNRFFFVATPTGESDSRIYTVDTVTGALLFSPTIVGSALESVQSLDYDAGESVLYAVRNPGDAGRQVVRLDPATGAVTPVSASISPPNGTPGGVSSLDEAGNRYFFVGTPGVETTQRIYTVDTATGALLGSPTIAGGPTTPVLGLAYDAAENKLFAFRNPGDAGRQIVIIDPATGAVTPVSGSISPPLGSMSGVVALDAAANQFFFTGVVTGETDWRLYTVDTMTGAVINNPMLVGSATAFFSGLEFAPVAVPPPVVDVTIDIKPGSFPNSVNVRSRGVIPVAILTTPSFDATTVDAATIRFGPGNAVEAHGRGHVEDVDGDGDLDLMLHFRTEEAAIPCGATSATLTGETMGGQAITGTDSVKTICK